MDVDVDKYLEMGGEVHFFGLLQAQSNKGNVGRFPAREAAKVRL